MSGHHLGRRLTRRTLLRDLGASAMGIAVVGLAAACDSGGQSGGGDPATAGGAPQDSPGADIAAGWRQVPLQIVSAYVLARDGEAVVVDTGTEGSAEAIQAVLSGAGLGWDAVGHVILTHRHPDHVGSLPAVLQAAPEAAAYAGAGDIDAITAPRKLQAVGDGDTVFDLEIVETPGHTPGHISVLDAAGSGVLVAGDALTGDQSGSLGGPDPAFSTNVEQANESVRKLGELTFDVALVGHGAPVVGGAAGQVAELAREL